MLIIVDKNTNKVINNLGNNSRYPNGDLPNISLKSNEKAVRINDNHPIAKEILKLKDYELDVSDDLITGVRPIQTLDEYRSSGAYQNNIQKKHNIDTFKKLNIDGFQLLKLLMNKGFIAENEMDKDMLETYKRKLHLEKVIKEV